ncbi:hypothetical protein QE152_g668 [Popillia japonica]|uniref:Uncharacterized protein n=1 Tax=Popillia japonica TaxID=7064 RepID=A0AAW1NJD9_POPJA
MVIEVIPACSIIVMVVVLALCSCWKRDRHKSEWIGLHGMVTQKNPDENVNHLPSVTLQPDVNNSENNHNAGDDEDISKRTTLTATNTRRSLPDIPFEPNRVDSNNTATWVEPASDNVSELYATVGQYQNSVKRHTLPNGLDSRPSISQHSSISQADDAYARVNYGQLGKKEHPYARVQNANHAEQDENSSDETGLLRASTSQNHNEPIAPQRSRRSSVHSGLAVDITAEAAVAGAIAANQDLPYMTPPIAQLNFSGDSQDSSKGYTSISVREPLANIRAQTKEINKLQRDLDPHYSTVSDDSDEVYTTIQEPNQQLYMSGSETYAQIQPLPLTVEVEVNPVPSSSRTSSLERQESLQQSYEPAPQPPSVDSLKHVAHSHSRQASSSSSVGLLGSPKPEKRQANSPLPPPPLISNSPDDPNPKNARLIRLYRRRLLSRTVPTFPDRRSRKASTICTLKFTKIAAKPLALHCYYYAHHHYRQRRARSLKQSPLAEEEEEIDKTRDSDQIHQTNYDEKKYIRKEHDYETLKKQFHISDCGSEPGYASINGPDSLLSMDPGYEVLKRQEAETSSEIDPNYEPLRHRTDSAGYCTIRDQVMDGYSVINKQRKMEDRQAKNCGKIESDEPNYESMPSDYAGGAKSTDSESDPNYESVNQNDPNYESVKYLDVNDPPYERLNDDDFTIGGSNKAHHSGYETIDVDSSKKSLDVPYEHLREDTSKTDSESSDYERIQSNNSMSDCLKPDYETIKPKSSDGSSSKEEPHYDTVNREKSGTSTSDDLPNSDEDIFEV